MAQELPNHHDFALTSVSVGDILYRRDSTHWANLHAGVSGQILTTHGAGLAPSWEDAGGGGDVSSAVILAPDTTDRNLIRPTADADNGLVIQPRSATQSGSLLEFRDHVGTQTTFFARDGSLAIQTQPSIAPSSNIFSATDFASATDLTLSLPGGGEALYIQNGRASDIVMRIVAGVNGQTAALLTVENRAHVRQLDVQDGKLGFLGAPAVARPSAYTLTGSATRAFPTDPSSAYSGIATAQVGTPYAQVSDLNTLRTAVSTLIGIVRQMATDLGHNTGFGLLNA